MRSEPFQDSRHLGKQGRAKVAFGWYGGKTSHLNWLLPLLPECHHYVEPFGGSAAVLLNRVPSPVETYNDLNSDVVNFFRILRDQGDELIRRLSLTPFSRAEYLESLHLGEDLSDIERARQFFIRARQVFFGLSEYASPGRWAYCKRDTSRGMSCSVSRWLGGIQRLDEISDRLLRVQIECLPATDLIQKYDDPGTLFYLDPPYHFGSRTEKKAYGSFEFSDAQHEELAEVLYSCRGKVAISGYDCQQMTDLYSLFEKHAALSKRINSSKIGSTRQECLWTNYEVQD
jgi:DNA adenine methylase